MPISVRQQLDNRIQQYAVKYGDKPVTAALLNELSHEPMYATGQKELAMLLWSMAHPDAEARGYLGYNSHGFSLEALRASRIIERSDRGSSVRKPARFRHTYYAFHPRLTPEEIVAICDWTDNLPAEVVNDAILLCQQSYKDKSPKPGKPRAKPAKPAPVKTVASSTAPLWQRMADSALSTAMCASQLNDLVNKVNEALGRPSAGLTCDTGPIEQTISGAMLAQRQALEVLELVTLSLSDAVKELAG